MKFIGFVLSSMLYKDLEELAHVYAGGNVSEYLRMLIARESAQFKCPRLFLAGHSAASVSYTHLTLPTILRV